ncbi:MAG: matrixin family metalloprotease [Nitrosopumilus sp.]|nr:matrixin family metalloprotease [Nitrosopumilus sp.]
MYEQTDESRNWDERSIDLERCDNAIHEKIQNIESILKKSKYDIKNKLGEQNNSYVQEGDMLFNQKLKEKIAFLENEKEHLVNQLITNKKILLLENDKEQLTTQIFTEQKIHELEKSNIELKIKLDHHTENLKEIKQEKLQLSEKADSKEESSFKMMKKYYLTIAIAGLVIGGFVGVFTFYENSIEQNSIMLVGEHAKSKYLVQNLRGDTLKTWFPWMLVGNQALHVNILANEFATPERINTIKDAVSSEEIIDIDNTLVHKGPKGTSSTYYKGWAGALNIAAQQNTELTVPTNFEFSSSHKPIGDITIELSALSDPDGYSGYTKSVVDQGEILKSHMVIYDVVSLSNEQLSTIFLHEFGHALGLAHSSAPDDLMYPVIETNFPYVSECMVDAISGLYDGMKASEVECQN